MTTEELNVTGGKAVEDSFPVAEVFRDFADDHFAFCPFESSLGSRVFRYFWSIPLLPLCVAVIAVLMAQSIPSKRIVVGDWITTTDRMVSSLTFSTASIIAPGLGILVLVAVMILLFARNAPKSFYALARAGRLQPPDALKHPAETTSSAVRKGIAEKVRGWFDDTLRIKPRQWQTFADDFQKALRSPWRHILTAIFTFTLYWGSIVAGVQGGSYLLFTGGVRGVTFQESVPFLLWAVMLIIVLPPMLGVFFSHGIWLLVVVGAYVQWMASVFVLDIQPRHGDECGGMKRVGNICLQMAAIVTVPASVFGFWVLAQILTSVIPVITIAMYVALAIMVVVGFLAFFLPLWRTHRIMVDAKARYQDEAIRRLAPVEARLRALVVQGAWDDGEIQKLERQLEQLRNLYPADIKYPIWPFDAGILIQVFSQQIVSFVALVTGAGDKTLAPLEKFFELVNALLR